MTIVDRYLLILFFKILLICLISFAGLFVVIHLFTNLDEFVDASETNGGLPRLLFEYYGPRVLDIFSRTAGVLVLISAIFALSMMQRRREMTAIEAAGIPKSRLVRPILMAAIVVLGLSVVSRELWIPRVKDRLVRTPANWRDGGRIPMNFQKDHFSGLLIRGQEILMEQNRITEPDIQIPIHLNDTISRIHGSIGVIEPAKQQRPAGLWMYKIDIPENLMEMPSMKMDGKTIVYSPRDYKWLQPDQCYVVCTLDAKEMAYGKQLSSYATLQEMMASLRKPRLWFGHRKQVEVHSRILLPFLDLTVILLGLPLVISKADRNIFTAAGFCLLVVIVVQLTTLACNSLGAFSLIRPAALAAWIPIIVFLPLAILSLRRLKS